MGSLEYKFFCLKLKYRLRNKNQYFKTQLTFTCESTIETLQKLQYTLKVKIKTPDRRHWRPSGVFINLEPILHLFLLFLLVTLNK